MTHSPHALTTHQDQKEVNFVTAAHAEDMTML